MKATADENQGEDVVSGFREKEIAGSKADELRVKLHEWKAEREEPRGRSTERDEIRVKLDAIPITANGKSSADGVGVEDGADDIEDEESTHSLGNGHLTPAFSASSYYSTASEHLTINSSQSSFGRARTITPPPIELLPSNAVELDYNAEDESEVLDHTPVFDSTPQFVMNSRATPPIFTTSLSPNDLLPPPPSSPAPVSPQSSSSPRLSNSSSPHSTMRRSLTTGPSSYPSTSSSPPPVSSRKPPHHHPNRTQSYHAPQSFSHAQDNSFTSQPPPLDEVESSIAAQAELIRKARLAKAKEQEQQRQAEEGIGAPIMKRRSTRAGSGSEHGNGGVLVGNLIGTDHSAYVLMYNMLTGIRIGVSRCQAKLKRPLTDADYTARHKFSFDIVGNELTPSTKYDFKFKDYAPWVFRELREYFYLDPSDYLVSLTAKYILSELGSPGKSGSFFYFSRDYRFIIKTIRHSEHKFLRSILKEYHEYVKGNPHTLLSRFYGLHRVKLPRGKKIHFVIMNNLFPPHRDIHEKYDLKGSSVGRIYPEEKAKNNPEAILKDLNWIQRGRELALGPEKKALFEAQLKRDTELLQRLGIMDYSLLTGIHNVHRGNVDNLRDGMLTVFQPDPVKTRRRKTTQVMRGEDVSALRKAVQRSDPQALSEANKLPEHDASERRLFLFYQEEGGIRATDENNEPLEAIYYLGIIDILTPYTLVKKLEHFFRSMKHDKHMISAVPPKEYGDRFMGFVYSIIRGNDVSLRPKMWHTPELDGEKGKVKTQ